MKYIAVQYLKFLPFQFSLLLMGGIVMGYHLEISLHAIIITLVVAYLALLYLYFKAEISYKAPISFSLITAILFFSIGLLRVRLQNPKYQKQHYTNFYEPGCLLTISIDKVLRSGKYYQKYEGRVTQMNKIPTRGKILINIDKSDVMPMQVDDVLLTVNALTEVNKALNPGAFDYQQYLKKKNIYQQLRLQNSDYIKLPVAKRTFRGIAFLCREKISNELGKYNFNPETLAIIQAILLGQRKGIGEELFANYKRAGAIHLLAVSGLHIGIILLFLNFLFKPIERCKSGKIVKLLLVVFCLWMYAFLAGLSASVVRSVTMFTAVAIGLLSNRPSGVKNSLSVSLFFLLLVNPYFLLDVGFQLSYVAVFSMVILHPFFKNLWQPKFKIVHYFWQILTVSFAAQLGVLPLSLYYFHQFPGLFFISSIVIIPFLGCILGTGILVILLALLQILPPFLEEFYNFMIRSMNDFVALIADQEYFIFENISFSFLLMCTVYLLLLGVVQWILHKTYRNLVFLFFTVLCLQMGLIYKKSQNLKSNEFVVFHQVKHSILGNRKGNKMDIYANLDTTKIRDLLNSYRLNFSDLEIRKNSVTKNIVTVAAKKILIMDSLGVYKDLKFRAKTIILTQSPKINLERLLGNMQPDIVIADGSNYKNYVALWEKTCEKKGIIFHNTSKKGAYQYHY